MAFDDNSGSVPTLALPRMTPVVRVLVIANIALALPFLFLIGVFPILERVLHWLSLSLHEWRELAPFVPLWQLVTFGFVHSPDSPMHLFGNLLALYFFGTWLEGLVGSRRFVWLYGLGLVVPALVRVVSYLLFGGGAPTIVLGASGAVMMVVVAMATLRPQATVILLFFPLKLWILAAFLVFLDLFGLVRGAGGTDSVVHLSGAALGFALAKFGWLWFDPVEAWRERSQAQRATEVQDDERKLDELLERIHREGIGSLSSRERAFLKRMSSRRGGG
jgi:membrane associated rhomboid family serine protease